MSEAFPAEPESKVLTDPTREPEGDQASEVAPQVYADGGGDEDVEAEQEPESEHVPESDGGRTQKDCRGRRRESCGVRIGA
jgi:hypothetical protein